MATQIKSWQILNDQLISLETTLSKEGRTEPKDLENWIEKEPSIIGSDIMIIGRQVLTKSGPLDLLALDQNGNTVIIELKRDKLPREALVQAIDYASDIANWNLDKISEIYQEYSNKNLEDSLNEHFTNINIENLEFNSNQRIILVGFSIESSLERMITWLSDNFNISINAIILKYIKTKGGEELLNRTSIISEEVEQEKIRKKRFQIPMSDEPGNYDDEELKKLLKKYLSQDLYSAKRIKNVLLPACLKKGTITRDELKEEFVKHHEAETTNEAGYFLSLISQQIGMAKNDFLRQIINYEYPNYSWEKDNYSLNKKYKELVKEVLEDLKLNN